MVIAWIDICDFNLNMFLDVSLQRFVFLQDLNENAAMAAVEQLMEEFFNPLTCNARKHEIERHLSDFRNFPHFTKLCLYFLSNSTSQYLTMFALSSLEVSLII